MASDQPTRALLHHVVTSAVAPDGVRYAVAYVEDPDGVRHLVFATSSRFGELELLPLLIGQEIALAPGTGCAEVLPPHLQSEEVQQCITEHRRLLRRLGSGLKGSSG
jgi:hypothetical protein